MPEPWMGPSLPACPRGCLAFGEEHVGIEDPGGVERPLDGPEGVDLDRAPVEVQPRPLGRADAVFGADAAAEAGHEPQDGVLHRRRPSAAVAAVRSEDVDVDVAVPGVAEEDAAGTGGGPI